MGLVLGALGLAGFGAFLWLSAPRPLTEADLPAGHRPDLENGRRIFLLAGCGGCHAAPDSKDRTRLPGGRELKTPFGIFRVPNVSPDPESGIGRFGRLDFVNAVLRGIAPDGSHYYPAFPYLSYQRMRVTDVLDLKAYMDTLPRVSSPKVEHDLPLPLRLRRGIGLWKRLYVDGRPFTPDPAASPKVNRGAYLVTGPGHCGECHTPRDLFGGLDMERFLAGAPAPEGEGVVPNLTPDPSGLGAWSEADIAYALESGFTPEYDAIGGTMAEIIDALAQIPKEDREAIAAYLKSIPPIPTERRDGAGGDSEGRTTPASRDDRGS